MSVSQPRILLVAIGAFDLQSFAIDIEIIVLVIPMKEAKAEVAAVFVG